MAVLEHLCLDEDYREELAKGAYWRERLEDLALAEEHGEGTETWAYALAWEVIPDESKRPYRTGVAVALDELARVVANA